MNRSFSPWPNFTKEEADAVHRVVLSNRVNYWTGSECRDFESGVASLCRHALCHRTGQWNGRVGCSVPGVVHR